MLIPLAYPGPLQSRSCLIIWRHFFRKQIWENEIFQRSYRKINRHGAGHFQLWRKRASGLTVVDICDTERDWSVLFNDVFAKNIQRRWLVNEYGALVEWHAQGTAKYWKSNLCQCHFVLHKSHLDWTMSEPGPPRWVAGVKLVLFLEYVNCLRKW
jgi:hypothetical protein